MKRSLFLFASLFYLFSGFSQEFRLKLGTEFPLQHYIGIKYQHNTKFSSDLSFGIVASPYNDELYDWIRVPSDKESRKDFLQQTTDYGVVFSFGLNYHINNWYVGFNSQLIQLNASETYESIINSDLVQNDISSGEKALLDSVLNLLNNPFSSLIVDLDEEVSIETTLFQLGIKVGRQFQFKNPKLSMHVELGITRNVYANTKTDYDRSLVPRIEAFAQNQVTGSNSDQIRKNLDFDERGEEINEFFEDYGYIPGLSLGISYLLHKK